jgi:hypothetical protein
VKVTIGLDAEREIKFGVNAITELEDRFDKSIHDLFSEENIQQTMSFRFFRAWLYVGLKHGGMKFRGKTKENEEQVGELLQEHWFNQGRTLEELGKLLNKAMELSGVFNTSKEDEEKGPNPPKEAEAQ